MYFTRNVSAKEIDAACQSIARSSQCFDGHKQRPVSRVPWEGIVGFDPDEVAHEKSLERLDDGLPDPQEVDATRFQLHHFTESPLSERPGYAQVTEDWVQKSACTSGLPEDVCSCHICNPREAIEEAEKEEVVELVRSGRMTIREALEELGVGFRIVLARAGIAA